MSKHILYIFLVFFVFMCACDGLSTRGGTKYNTRSELNKATAAPESDDDYNPTRKGLGISAWGIVAVVVSFFLAVVGMYYVSICYPVLCKKSKNYDIMGLTPA